MIIFDPSLTAVLDTEQLYFHQLLFTAAYGEPPFSAIDDFGVDDFPGHVRIEAQ